ncbi:MAG: hypothetical protein KDC39_11360 [Actinobacteria bacterium]|nr:hypothetical protein [Actinomycetota bacterium]
MSELRTTSGHVSARHRATLEKIENHPASGNIEWRDVISALAAVGDVTERHDGKFLIVLGDEREVFDPPRGKDIDKQMVVDLRRMIRGIEVPQPQGHNSVPPGKDAIVALDYHRARIFDIARRASAVEDVDAPDPWLLNRHLHHKYYFEHQHYDLDQSDTDKMFEAIHADLKPYEHVVVAGHGSGKANAAQVFEKWLAKHHRESTGKIVGTVRIDIDDITDHQLLRWAEEYFGADQPERDYADSRRGEPRD